MPNRMEDDRAGKERHFNDLSRLAFFGKLRFEPAESVHWRWCQNWGANLSQA